MQDRKQGTNQARTGRRNTGGLPVARDATQINEMRCTPEIRGDRDEQPGSADHNRERSPQTSS